MRHMPSFLIFFCFSSNLVYARNLCVLTRRWCTRVHLWWKTWESDHILNEIIDPMSIIPSSGSIIKTSTWSSLKHLSSIQSIRLILRQNYFAMFCSYSFTNITRMFTYSFLSSPLHCISISSMPTSISSSVNLQANPLGRVESLKGKGLSLPLD